MFASLAILLPLVSTLVSAASFAVDVGSDNGTLAYDPQFITGAEIGDTVVFKFHPKAHSVTEAAFASPCSQLQGGLDTGLMPVTAGTADASLPIFTYTVQATSPKWFYCKQQGPPIHCQQGMVFAINPSTDPTGNTFQKFQDAAKALASAGNATNSTITTTSATASYTAPPPPVVETVTVTVTAGSGNVYTTTYASWEGSQANPTPAAQPATHTIQVGNNGQLTFDPPQISAEINDIVKFVFHAKAHSATQSNFETPCSPKDSGFDTGLMPVAADVTDFPEFSVKVNDTLPIWVYCKQQGPPIHCQQGMVFAVNAPASGPNTFDAFQQLAIHSGSLASNNTNTTGGSSTGTGSAGAPASTTGSGKSGAEQVVISIGAIFLGFVGVVFSL
ncbi:hypothetical protein M422DRAFT_28355 [Sphaerobolus stellatus SS14]|nr:hypothetical protein M422DRAFT_28355 [Sphaerobolus stellatus SS14]